MYDKCIVLSFYCDLHEFYQDRDIPNMCLKYAKHLTKICLIYATYIRYTGNMPEICLR